jgi:flagellum-specific peptidoglycan hydrolase FlgJ
MIYSTAPLIPQHTTWARRLSLHLLLSSPSTQQAFLTLAASSAVESQRVTDVPAELTLPQAIFESGWGAAMPHNNCLGIKANDNGFGNGSFTTPTQEYVDGKWITETLAFESYASLTMCFEDHGWLISHGVPYASVWSRYNANPQAPGALAEFILDVGHVYATAPGYGMQILSFSQSTIIVNALRAARSADTLVS